MSFLSFKKKIEQRVNKIFSKENLALSLRPGEPPVPVFGEDGSKQELPFIERRGDPPVPVLIDAIERGGMPPCFAPDTFMRGDLVVCIDDTPDYGPFGKFDLPPLKKGDTYIVQSVEQYNIRGEILNIHTDGDWKKDGYEARHFNLVKRG